MKGRLRMSGYYAKKYSKGKFGNKIYHVGNIDTSLYDIRYKFMDYKSKLPEGQKTWQPGKKEKQNIWRGNKMIKPYDLHKNIFKGVNR